MEVSVTPETRDAISTQAPNPQQVSGVPALGPGSKRRHFSGRAASLYRDHTS